MLSAILLDLPYYFTVHHKLKTRYCFKVNKTRVKWSGLNSHHVRKKKRVIYAFGMRNCFCSLDEVSGSKNKDVCGEKHKDVDDCYKPRTDEEKRKYKTCDSVADVSTQSKAPKYGKCANLLDKPKTDCGLKGGKEIIYWLLSIYSWQFYQITLM